MYFIFDACFQNYIKTVSSDQTESDQTIFQGNSKSVQQ